jgi:hypothetical protein
VERSSRLFCCAADVLCVFAGAGDSEGGAVLAGRESKSIKFAGAWDWGGAAAGLRGSGFFEMLLPEPGSMGAMARICSVHFLGSVGSLSHC